MRYRNLGWSLLAVIGLFFAGCAGSDLTESSMESTKPAVSSGVEILKEENPVRGFPEGMDMQSDETEGPAEETGLQPEGGVNLNERDLPENGSQTGSVEELLADMTLEQKIYQMFIVTPEQLTGVSNVTAAGDMTRSSLERCPVGGLVYFASNLVSREQTRDMLLGVQAFSCDIEGVPLFLCVDEEGGRVARIAKNEAFQVEQIGSMAGVSSEEEAYRSGAVIGSYLSELGFNVDFAPDADVITNENNSVIGDRSFGADAGIVTSYAAAYSNGLHVCGILSTFKHFPGHGATEGDTHEGYAYTNKSYEELLEAELRPFAAAQENGVDMVMAAHISVPAVIGDGTPCSLSERMLTGILRNELNYQGLIVTDALNMGAISVNYDSQTAAVQAVKAGADLLLMPKDLNEAFSGIYNAVINGEISEARIDESVRRILLKKKEIAGR